MENINKIIEQIKEKISLTELDNNKYKCSCPFHDEAFKSEEGTLVIVPDSDMFHCFGCGIDGNLEELLEKIS